MIKHTIEVKDLEGKHLCNLRLNDWTWTELAKLAAKDNITMTHLMERILWEMALKEVKSAGAKRKRKPAKARRSSKDRG